MNQTVDAVAAAEEREEARLLAARDAFPAWKIIETCSGAYVAVPKETVLVDAIDLDHLVRQLREQQP